MFMWIVWPITFIWRIDYAANWQPDHVRRMTNDERNADQTIGREFLFVTRCQTKMVWPMRLGSTEKNAKEMYERGAAGHNNNNIGRR